VARPRGSRQRLVIVCGTDVSWDPLAARPTPDLADVR